MQWVVIIGVIGVLLVTSCVLSVLCFKQKKRLNDLKKAKKRLATHIEIQIAKHVKAERTAMAQNLHDDLAGTLAAIKNNIDIALQTNNTTQLKHVNEMVAAVYHHVRNKSHELLEQKPVANLTFTNELLKLTDTFFASSAYKTAVEIEEEAITSINTHQQNELLLIIKEAFTNILKHSKATNVSVTLYKESQKVYLVIADNGVGLPTHILRNGYGLKSIEKRVKAIKGTLNLNKPLLGAELEVQIYVN
ncbi:histidine kinase [Flavobacterium sp. CBA20B-1]|uniref:sensor histidine kinase n=1 Tax=unclassified Flavobacterium TaxID=196869 RepID=UPI00222465E1|nr:MULTISPECIES: ATP-binding protein [unclassified Flavobacterium]WCM41306.1 histidine kinase [Flavobacterium sp. CBA20B-1]